MSRFLNSDLNFDKTFMQINNSIKCERNVSIFLIQDTCNMLGDSVGAIINWN